MMTLKWQNTRWLFKSEHFREYPHFRHAPFRHAPFRHFLQRLVKFHISLSKNLHMHVQYALDCAMAVLSCLCRFILFFLFFYKFWDHRFPSLWWARSFAANETIFLLLFSIYHKMDWSFLYVVDFHVMFCLLPPPHPSPFSHVTCISEIVTTVKTKGPNIKWSGQIGFQPNFCRFCTEKAEKGPNFSICIPVILFNSM